MNATPSIVWFYNDLRLGDHAALSAAAARGPVVPLFILDDSHKTGGAARWALRQSLAALARDLKKRGLDLILRRGEPLAVLRAVIAETGARALYCSRRYEPALAARDAKIAAALREDGIEALAFGGFLLFDPAAIRTKAGQPFRVFTPFSKACFSAPAPARLLPVPENLRGIGRVLASDDANDWKLVPPQAVWPQGLAEAWPMGERAAQEKLRAFIDEPLAHYKDARDSPGVAGTSRLSPYLHFGAISPRAVWHAIQRAQTDNPALAPHAERYLLELLWREFSWHLLADAPDLASIPLQKQFMRFPWRNDPEGLRAWQRGLTGFPMIDAGMRELWQTGWMHNRVRMIVASFLIKDLLIDWREGLAWFDDTLVDADAGSNAASWQWVAGCGADAAPYFRIFNPVLQSRKFDPKGDYIRRFVPEIAGLDAEFIHEPQKAPPECLKKAGIELGKTYPRPILDHAAARKRALLALKETKISD